jgi:hypothetical protein
VKTLRRLVFPQAPSPIITNFLLSLRLAFVPLLSCLTGRKGYSKKRLVVIETSGALGPEPLAGRCLTEGERGERETMKSGPGPMCSGLKIAGVMLRLGGPMQVIAQGRGDDSYQIIENDDL